MHRVLVCPVRELHHVILIGVMSFTCAGLDDQSAVHPRHFLKTGMAVVPVGAALAQLKTVGKGFAWGDAFEADTWHTVHLIRQQDAVPVNGR